MSDVSGEVQRQLSQNPMKIVHIILAVIMACLVVGSLKNADDYGMFTKTIAFIAGVASGYLGALLGDFVRKLFIPDMIFTTGGFSAIVKQKLFWFIGPQAVAAFFAVAVGAGGIIKLADQF